MKILNKIFLAAATLAIAGGMASCKKALEEELVGTLTNEYYDTEQGIEDLVKASYEPVRYKFGYENAYALYNMGVDEYTYADQINYNYYNNYDTRLAALPGGTGDSFMYDTWANDYIGIDRCNTGLEKLPTVTGVKTLLTPAARNTRLAELHFLRAYYYFQLVQQFGPVPIVTQSSSSAGPRKYFDRSPVPAVYQQIINDFRFAVDNLPAAQADFGRATKGAAQHFLAKTYLTRGSAVADQRGQKTTDIDSAAYYADLVINSNTYALESDYARLWNGVYVAPGDYSLSQAAQRSKEILFSAQFNNIATLAGSLGNQTHMYYLMAYDQEPGMQRDLFNGRPFRRLMPTNYAMDIYDRKNDSRFYKEMKLAYNSNNAATIPKIGTTPKYALGDTAFYVVVNTPQTTLTEAQKLAKRYNMYARYYKKADGSTGFDYNPFASAVAQRQRFPSLVKFIDPFRPGGAGSQIGTKDGILARLAETYLIAAEAWGRKGDYGKAVGYINILRQRAAYKAGEAKPQENYLFEGGTRGDVSGTYPALTITASYFDANEAKEMYPASATNTASRFIHFILNERTRELLGELYRWEDLARTETLIERAKTFNNDAASIQPFHKLRPIPQLVIDRMSINGSSLSTEQRRAYQNTGY